MKIPYAITVDVESDYWDKNTTVGVTHGLPLILDLFNRLEIKGVFFWTAETAQKHPDILTRVMKEGHEIGCHGFCHEDFSVLGETQQSDILQEAAYIFRSFGAICKGFRAPRLRVNDSLFPILLDHGFIYDSSIPFWGIRRYKYGTRYDRPGLPELKCVPSYAFRIFNKSFSKIVMRSFDRLGYVVFFLHPWEVIKQPPKVPHMPYARRLNVINTIHVGPEFLDILETYLFRIKDCSMFQTCIEMSEMVEQKTFKSSTDSS